MFGTTSISIYSILSSTYLFITQIIKTTQKTTQKSIYFACSCLFMATIKFCPTGCLDFKTNWCAISKLLILHIFRPSSKFGCSW